MNDKEAFEKWWPDQFARYGHGRVVPAEDDLKFVASVTWQAATLAEREMSNHKQGPDLKGAGGSPAFPVAFDAYGTPYASNMTLRDHFAAKALQGILASVHTLPQAEMDIVNQAYSYADEMLAAREV